MPRQKGLERELVLVTPEPRPLALFGDRASATVAEMLAAAGVEFVGESHVEPVEGAVRLLPGGRMIAADRLVALPLLRGPELDGVPSEPDFGFIPVDPHGRVDGLDGVYAAGDATNFPIKQGGLATQQADAVAEHVAARHGVRLDPAPFRPVLRGMLFAGGADRYLRAATTRSRPSRCGGRRRRSPGATWRRTCTSASRRPKPGPAPEGFVDLEVPLEAAQAAPVGR